MKFDIVIIGGGPAGVSLGMSLLLIGRKCCIIDRAKFPREKLCAGVLTIKTQKIIKSIFPDLIWENVSCSDIKTLNIYKNMNLIGQYSLNYSYKVVDRLKFDYELIKCYLAKGGILFENEGNYSIDYSNNKIILSDNETIEYSFIIGADGINSNVRKYVDPKYKPHAFCLASLASDTNTVCQNEISAHFGVLSKGYGWSIPCNNTCSIGMAGAVSKKHSINLSHYNAFCDQAYNIRLQKPKGQFLSDGTYVKKPFKNNVVLIGDAAGLADAISGEGIYFAIYSGILAGKSIEEYYETGNKVNYNKKIKEVHKIINQQKLFRCFLYTPIIQDITFHFVKKNPAWAKYIFDEVISSYKDNYIDATLKLLTWRWRCQKKK